MASYPQALLASEPALAFLRDGHAYPELDLVRQEMENWRIFHDFRTDAGSQIRQPAAAVATATLDQNGHNLAAAIATLTHIREDATELQALIDDAFPGADLDIQQHAGKCALALKMPDIDRPFAAHELSDGTLKYLCLLGAMMSYRTPGLMAFNEPEVSLHPNLLPPLARLFAKAAERGNIWIVTHSEPLSDQIAELTNSAPYRVVKTAGATHIENLTITGSRTET